MRERTHRKSRPANGRNPGEADRANGAEANSAHWRRKLEHYLALARASADRGDRVEAESCYQHADHYYRLIQGTAA